MTREVVAVGKHGTNKFSKGRVDGGKLQIRGNGPEYLRNQKNESKWHIREGGCYRGVYSQ